MKRLIALMMCAVSLAAAAQFPSLPYNPDENGDGLIGVTDLQGLLSNYGSNWETMHQELVIDSIFADNFDVYLDTVNCSCGTVSKTLYVRPIWRIEIGDSIKAVSYLDTDVDYNSFVERPEISPYVELAEENPTWSVSTDRPKIEMALTHQGDETSFLTVSFVNLNIEHPFVQPYGDENQEDLRVTIDCSEFSSADITLCYAEDFPKHGRKNFFRKFMRVAGVWLLEQ